MAEGGGAVRGRHSEEIFFVGTLLFILLPFKNKFRGPLKSREGALMDGSLKNFFLRLPSASLRGAVQKVVGDKKNLKISVLKKLVLYMKKNKPEMQEKARMRTLILCFFLHN